MSLSGDRRINIQLQKQLFVNDLFLCDEEMFIDGISKLLGSFQVSWTPQESELRCALEILRLSFAILHHFDKPGKNFDYPICVKNAFK